MKKDSSKKSTNGKGDKPRSCFSKQFKDNYDEIFRKKKESKKEI